MSSAETHAYDMHKLFRSERMALKPILLMETDGAQDVAASYLKPLAAAIFLLKGLKLDALLHGISTSSLSGFNPVERQITPLSHDILGIILLHDYFGNHLDTNGKTKDIELEKRNFFKAAEVLAEIWSNMVIEGHKVEAKVLLVGLEYELELLMQQSCYLHSNNQIYGQ